MDMQVFLKSKGSISCFVYHLLLTALYLFLKLEALSLLLAPYCFINLYLILWSHYVT